MLFAMLSCLAASAAVGDTFTSGALTFTVLSESPAKVSVKATDAKTISGDIVIPPSVTNDGTTYTVAEIAAQAFNGATLITSVSIPDFVTVINGYAFQDCSKIKTISLPKSVTALGNGPFAACTSLTEILADGDTFYSKDGVLYKGKNLTELIQFPAGKGDSEFVVPSSVTTISVAAFSGCSNLKSITIPATTTTLQPYLFWNCTNLNKVVNLNPIPQSVESGTFQGFKTSNAVLYVPSISKAAYAADNVWKTFKEIRGIEFYLDANDVTLKIDETLDLKNKTVSAEDIKIKSVTWNSSNTDVATVDSEGVVTAVALGKATITVTVVDENNQSYSDECEITVATFTSGDLTFTVTSADPTKVSVKATDAKTISGVVIIPSTITKGSTTYTIVEIAGGGFRGATLITSVSIPETVTTIGGYAFMGCTKIKSISIPKSVTTMHEGPFSGCTSLTEILADGDTFYSKDGLLYKGENLTELVQYPAGKSDTEFVIPSTVTNILSAAVRGCENLKSITIPSETKALSWYVFTECPNLTKVVDLNPTPQSTYDYTFVGSNISNAVLYVPSSSKSAYEAAKGWNTFKEIRAIEFYLDTKEATLKPGKTLDLRNNIVNTAGVEVKSLTWNSSDTDIATVDSEGVVTAVADGKATITVNVVDENDQTYTDECEITVDSTSDITVITTDSKGVIDYSAAYDVFTVNGVLVGKSVESLAPGLYIVRQKAASAKILVK